MDNSLLVQLVLNGLVLSLTYILIASGLTLVFGILNVLNFAHGEFYVLGSYATFYLFGQFGINYVLAVILSFLMIGLLGLIIERIFYRPIRGQPIPGIIVALALVLLLESAASLLFGNEDRFVSSPVSGVLHIFGASLTWQRLLIIVVSASIILGLYFAIRKLKFGRAIRAVAEDREAAALQGVNVDRMCLLTFGIGCALAGVAGALLIPEFFVNPYGGLGQVLKAALVIVLGGLGSVPGTIAGGFILGFVDSIGQSYIGGMTSLLSFILILLILIVRPRGLMGVTREEQ